MVVSGSLVTHILYWRQHTGDAIVPLSYQLQALPLMLISGAEESDSISKSIIRISSVALPFTRSSLSFGTHSRHTWRDAYPHLHTACALSIVSLAETRVLSSLLPAPEATTLRCDTLPSLAFLGEPWELLKHCYKSRLLASWLILQHREGISDLLSAPCLAQKALGCW